MSGPDMILPTTASQPWVVWQPLTPGDCLTAALALAALTLAAWGLWQMHLASVARNRQLDQQSQGLERQSESLERQSQSLERQSESLERQSESLERQSQSLERQSEALVALTRMLDERTATLIEGMQAATRSLATVIQQTAPEAAPGRETA